MVGVVLRQAWSKSQRTVLMGYLTSQQMLDAIKYITDDNFFFQEDSAQVHCVCNIIKLEMWANAQPDGRPVECR